VLGKLKSIDYDFMFFLTSALASAEVKEQKTYNMSSLYHIDALLISCQIIIQFYS